MPILPVPVDAMDTICTIITQCKYIVKTLNIPNTVITFDQALCCRIKEGIWVKFTDFQNVVLHLGPFHTAMNFMKAIGQHMQDSGLKDMIMKVEYLANAQQME